jgi:hypothetical protein
MPRSSATQAAKGSARRIAGARSLGEGGQIASPIRLGDVGGSAEPRWKTGLANSISFSAVESFADRWSSSAASLELESPHSAAGSSATAEGRTQNAVCLGEESALQVKLRAERLDDDAATC